MTVLMITFWLALQLPAGILVGRVLQHGLLPLPVRTGPRFRR